MFTVKLSIAADNANCNRQLPQGGFVWKNYRFLINQDVEEADFWVMYSKGRRMTETCRVSPENTLFITGEPDSVYHYSQGYVNQFARVISCQQHLKHRNLKHDQPAQPWHIGKRTHKTQNGKESTCSVDYSQSYDTLKTSHPEKTKLISVITSNKAFTKGHRERVAFVTKLKQHYGDRLDLFGFGFREFADKWDVIAPYQYHIAIENCSTPYYWTEKLADTYLGNAFPIYYGCPNIGDYFDSQSYIAIDIRDADEAIRKIDAAIEGRLSETRAAAVEQAKQQVLDQYNLFNLIAEQLDTMDPDAEKQLVTIREDASFFDLKKIYVMVIKRFFNKLASKFCH